MFPGGAQSVAEPEAADEVALLRRVAEVVGPDYFEQWLASSVPSLDGQTPASLMQSEGGRRELERVLTRIEQGVY